MNIRLHKTLIASTGALMLGAAQAQVAAPAPFYNDDLPLNNARPFTPQMPSSAFPEPIPTLPGGAAGSSDAYTLLNSRFSRFDMNFDGKLGREEVEGDAGLKNRFLALDKNKDGYLSLEEHAASASVPDKFVP